LRVDLSLQPQKSIGDQLKHADRKGTPVAVIVGEAELAEGRVAVKNLRSGEQRSYDRAELAPTVAAIVAE
jgi:histidyl-tRNA synthetase